MNSKGEIVIRWDESKYPGTRISVKGTFRSVVKNLAFATVYELRRIARNGNLRELLYDYISVLLHLANDEELETVTFDMMGGETNGKEAQESDL